MKKCIITTIIFALILITGCDKEKSEISLDAYSHQESTNLETESNEMNSRDIFVDSSREEAHNRLFSISDNEVDYNSKITHTISSENFLNDYFFHMYSTITSFHPTLDIVDEKYKIECLRDMEANKKYTIYKSDDGGLFFVFYISGGMQSHSAYISKTLYFDDFKYITEGTNLNVVKEIDNTVSIWTDSYIKEGQKKIKSIHLLKDGVLVYSYSRKDNGEYVVSNIYYSKDFVYKSDITDGQGDTMSYDYTILEHDYPN